MPDQIIKEALDQYAESVGQWEAGRIKVVDDIIISQVNTNQWDSWAKKMRRNRPQYSINQFIHPLNQMNGAFKKTHIEGNFRPANKSATREVANTLNGIMRNISNLSRADLIYNASHSHIAAGGFSCWKLGTIEAHDDLFDQELRIIGIDDPFLRVWPDASSKDILSRNWSYCHIVTDMPKKKFVKKYPRASLAGFPQVTSRWYTQWNTYDSVKVSEYWVREETEKTVVLFSNGWKEEFSKVEGVLGKLQEIGITIVKKKRVKSHKVVSYLITANEVIAGPFDWAGTRIPVIPVYGYNTVINNELHYHGKVRFAKDAQYIYNYATTAKIESTALTPKDPYFITKHNTKSYEEKYRNYNRDNPPFLPYTPDPANGGVAPQRGGAPAVQTGLIEQAQQAKADIHTSMGIFNSTIGNTQGAELNLGAQRNLQEQTDIGSFDLISNMQTAIGYTWELAGEIIPKIYDTERIERIIGAEGEEDNVEINKVIIDSEGKEVIINDLSQGKYDLTVTVRKSFQTQRDENLALLSSISQIDPDLAQRTVHLIAKNADGPIAGEIERIAREIGIQRGYIEPSEEEQKKLQEKQEKNAPQMEAQKKLQAAAAKMQFESASEDLKKKKLDNLKTAIEVDKTEAGKEKIQAEISKIIADTLSTYLEAGVELTNEDVRLKSISTNALSEDILDTDKPNQNGTAGQSLLPAGVG